MPKPQSPLPPQDWWQTFPWGLLSVIIAVVAIGVTVTVYRKNRKRKTLDYQLINDVKILSEQISTMRSEIVVAVDKVTLRDPRIVTVRFINTGNQEIVQEDFLAGSITTADGQGVVNSQLVGTSDLNIETTESGVMPHRTYTVDCLNPGESIDIQYVLDMAGIDDTLHPFVPVCRVKGATRPPKCIERRPTASELVEITAMIASRGAYRALALPTPRRPHR